MVIVREEAAGREPSDVRIEPIELARLRRLAENLTIATLSDEHLAAIRWGVRMLEKAAEDRRAWDAEWLRHARWRDRVRAAVAGLGEAIG